MEIAKSFNLELIIRYGFSGFTALVVLLIFPCLVRDFTINLKLFSENMLGLVTISFVIGYLFDSLKIYKLTIGYKGRKDKFDKQLSEILDIKKEEATVYFTALMQDSKKHNGINLDRKNAEWHFLDNTAKIFALSALVWICFIVTEKEAEKIWLYSLLLLVSFFLTWRLLINSSQERTKIDKLIYKYAEANKGRVNEFFEIKKEQPAS